MVTVSFQKLVVKMLPVLKKVKEVKLKRSSLKKDPPTSVRTGFSKTIKAHFTNVIRHCGFDTLVPPFKYVPAV